ncbi:MAG: insulinase family protein [Herpetosiphonaceae bacterium]|nr:insulinase family protein [Herpetosiphonaceae bacterium]
MRYDQATLPNGLQIIGEHNPDAQSVALGFFARTGSRDETPEISGVSHFLEHMMFKGTERRSPEDVNREFDEMGANYNAFTSEENTVYFGAVLPKFQGQLVDLLADMMRPTLRTSDFDTEKKVILEEIAMYKDRPQSVLFDVARETYHHGHPLGNSVLGSTESITALERDRMLEYFERRYAPNNLLLVLTGNYDWTGAVAQATAASATWQPADAPRALSAPEPYAYERMVADPKRDRVYIALVAPAPAAQTAERFAAEVLAAAVGGGEGSRLYWALVHGGLADSVGLWYDSSDGAGAFYTYASCSPERVQEVLQIIRATLETAQRDGLSEDELARARRKIASGLMLGAETPMGRLTAVGFDWVYRKAVMPLNEVADHYLAVTPTEVAKLLQTQPFATLTVVVLGPLAEATPGL